MTYLAGRKHKVYTGVALVLPASPGNWNHAAREGCILLLCILVHFTALYAFDAKTRFTKSLFTLRLLFARSSIRKGPSCAIFQWRNRGMWLELEAGQYHSTEEIDGRVRSYLHDACYIILHSNELLYMQSVHFLTLYEGILRSWGGLCVLTTWNRWNLLSLKKKQSLLILHLVSQWIRLERMASRFVTHLNKF